MKLDTLTESDLIVYQYKVVCECRETAMFQTHSAVRAIGMAVANGWVKVRGRVLCPECKSDLSPNASLSIPGGEPGYAPGDCCAAPEDPRKTFENEYMLHPLPLAPACPNCQRGRLEERVSHGSHVGFRCVGDFARGVERCGWKSFDLHNAEFNRQNGAELHFVRFKLLLAKSF